MRIGIVDLDTSHPENWVPIERELGHEIVGVIDHGEIHPKGYAEEFAKKLNIPRVFASLEEMVPTVDCAALHSCDWDTRVERARPFAEAGKALLVDKPIAGRGADIEQFRKWARAGVRITGGSSLRFCNEVRDWLVKPVRERGEPHTVFCGCGVDEFNYGIHAYSMLSGIMGPGVASVQHLAEGPQRRIRVNWKDGRVGFLVIGKAEWQPFYATVVTTKGATHLVADSGKLYRAILEACLPYLAGRADAPIPFDDLIEPELCALAARMSWLNHNREVMLSEVGNSTDGYDGAAFGAEYKAEKYPLKK